MKEYPILFNAEMVKAILAGNKTQTRRLKAPWKVGDLLYVREAFRYYEDPELLSCIQYRADKAKFKPDFDADHAGMNKAFQFSARCEQAGTMGKRIPSIHMPKKFSRIKLRVTEMRTEKLQAITFNDAYEEGVNPPLVAGLDVDINGEYWQHGVRTVIKAFAALWDSCAKPDFRWSDNPDVIVTKFERVQK